MSDVINLSKGQNISLSKTAPGAKVFEIALGWKPRTTDGAAFDLDASAIILYGENKKAKSAGDFVFYHNNKSACGSIVHSGDDQSGADGEVIIVDTTKFAEDVSQVVFPVTIDEAIVRGQNFGQVDNAYIEVRDAESKKVISRFDLSEDASTETAMLFGTIYRKDGGFSFKAVGQGYAGGLDVVLSEYGLRGSFN
jgi:tellurium resistance protein TerD